MDTTLESKKVLLSGKLNGTRSLISDLQSIENPDEIEKFLLEFTSIKFEETSDNEIIYIADDQDFLESMAAIENSSYISLNPTANFSKLYVTTDQRKTYVIRLNSISSALIGTFIAKEKPVKYGLNSFAFIKWCISKNIDIRNIYDIPTYIKLLTNEVDPFKSVKDYIEEYTNCELKEDDNEANNIMIGNFIYDFGKFLDRYVSRFDLSTVCKLINENSYFEGNSFDNAGNCEIQISYTNLENAIQSIVENKANEFQEKAYMKSPLGRIAIKFGHKPAELLGELYLEDISLTVLNELYNNNIPVLLENDNQYKITCKYKNFNNVIALINAVFNDVFYSIFEQSAEMKIDCILKN
ncbi:MAG: hypothetical protein IJ217_01865 [Clostridia bacterium]|nr:hypothetical protein [Clostridia bacterium]